MAGAKKNDSRKTGKFRQLLARLVSRLIEGLGPLGSHAQQLKLAEHATSKGGIWNRPSYTGAALRLVVIGDKQAIADHVSSLGYCGCD